MRKKAVTISLDRWTEELIYRISQQLQVKKGWIIERCLQQLVDRYDRVDPFNSDQVRDCLKDIRVYLNKPTKMEDREALNELDAMLKDFKNEGVDDVKYQDR